MIHMGAAMGKILSQGLTSSSKPKWMPDLILFKRFKNMYDRRNFISAGAAAGVGKEGGREGGKEGLFRLAQLLALREREGGRKGGKEREK